MLRKHIALLFLGAPSRILLWIAAVHEKDDGRHCIFPEWSIGASQIERELESNAGTAFSCVSQALRQKCGQIIYVVPVDLVISLAAVGSFFSQ